MFLLLIQRSLVFQQPPPLFPLVHLERTRRALKVLQTLLPKYNGLFDDIVEEFYVVGDEDECTGFGGEVSFEPDGRFQILS